MRRRQKKGPREAAALPTKKAPNQGVCKGERATKARLRGRVKGPHRYPQHSAEAEDTPQDRQETRAQQERLV